jgi:hypothetical protein
VIVAYFDDSGTNADHPALVMGGCLATIENWKEFSCEWLSVLAGNRIDCFHMTDFDNRRGDFSLEKCPEEKRIPMQSALLGILKQRIQAIVVAATNKQDYAQVESIYGIKIFPYTAYQCLSGVEQWANEVGYDGPISYVFDEGGGSKELGTRGSLDQLLSDIWGDPELKRRFQIISRSCWNYGSVKATPALQGADLVAYEAWKDLQNDFFAKGKKRWRISAGKLIMMERVYQAYFDAEVFRGNHLNHFAHLQSYL